MTDELMKLQTYGRLYQRLVSTHGQIPLGIYRSVPIDSCPEIVHSERPHENRDTASTFLNSKMRVFGMDGGGKLYLTFGGTDSRPSPPLQLPLQMKLLDSPNLLCLSTLPLRLS